ncbi:sucrose-6-phosphate hydrolase [Enterococcus sp. JM4C]|uniref:sucrose-6-phosphate hydrolase n=1 Tax=Candidatus Enterococcus huntleyi TaxID=1857217 RepID=UPI00137AD520|nr:sucrose-6-phosphate hydrolase [Enterococcus sp. JM4C]KAF1297808.1 sucrose-6-phosphate hydrolase [Enterococcus sp. JM4C]
MPLKKQWTQAQRYRPYKEWPQEYFNALEQTVNASIWRLHYHIQPQTGLLNDPNGFSYFNEKWHVFYQSYPMGPVHGIKSWYHMSSANLVDWQAEGTTLLPDGPFDSHGVYSGSALPLDDKLFMAYTGNVRDETWQRHSYQLGAFMTKDGQIEKLEQPLIVAPPAGYTAEFRDPQIFRYKEEYLLVIGAQNQEEAGEVLTYSSADLLNWTLIGNLRFTEEKMGFMVECPNLLIQDEFALLLFCPQGLDPAICSYQNIYPNMYTIGERYDRTENQLVNPSVIKNLDEGFDVYATQAFIAPDNRMLAISWVGLPEIDYPTDQENWAHCLSMVKELTVKDQILYQQPVKEMVERRCTEPFNFENNEAFFYDSQTNCYELNLTFEEGAVGTLTLFSHPEQNQGLMINFDSKHGKIKIDRSLAGVPFAEDYGQTREFSIKKQALSLQIFVDSSVVEVFINEGQEVATMRAFPSTEQTGFQIDCSTNYTGTLWQLRKNTVL